MSRRGLSRGLPWLAVACTAAPLIVVSLYAQAPAAPGAVLTLQTAVEQALMRNPSIAAARLSGAVNAAGLLVARERLNPELSVELERETPKQAFGVAVPLELGGKRERRIAVSQATIAVGDAELAATIADIRNEVRRAYFDAVVADAKLTLLREQRDLAQRTRDTAQARFDSGDAPRLEVVQADLALATTDNDVTGAQGAVTAARTKLNALLGLPLDTVSSLSTAIDEGGAGTVAVPADIVPRSTAVIVLDRELDTQRAKLRLARALRTPDITPSATLTHDSDPEFTWGWRAAFAVTLPIFTSHKAGVVVEERTLDQLTAERDATVRKITADVAAATTTAESQRQVYMRYRDTIVPQAQQLEQLAQDAYQLGQTGIAALLQALQASRDVRLKALDAAAQFQTSLADLERAIGAPLP
jgi:cobalt-zinc-cadmium efflux system outer membrane protein